MSEDARSIRVAELGNLLRSAVENSTRGLWVLGEAGKIVRSPAGHVYFTLKDPEVEATVDCVLYKREAMRFGRVLREGALLELRGMASYYAPRGRLQWIVSEVREAGEGQHLLRLQKLKEQLEKEGLFSPEKKRPLPAHPRVIGVVTSRTGAAFHDIVKVVSRRAKVRIVLSNCLVQGNEAAPSIVQALDRIERLPELDVLIVGRGGGSKEDLMVWNDENVVRRLARCRVPVVSAVGHEIDLSLSDFVSDVRAATPSQAAELVTPDEAHQRVVLDRAIERLSSSFETEVVKRRMAVARASRMLGEPRVLLGQHQQSLHEVALDLASAMRRSVSAGKKRERALVERLSRLHPKAVLLEARARFSPLSVRLPAALTTSLRKRRYEMEKFASSLDAMSPLKVLGRGYALAISEEGKPLFRARDAREGDEVTVRLHEGRLVTRVVGRSLDNEPGILHQETPRQESPPSGGSSGNEA